MHWLFTVKNKFYNSIIAGGLLYVQKVELLIEYLKIDFLTALSLLKNGTFTNNKHWCGSSINALSPKKQKIWNDICLWDNAKKLWQHFDSKYMVQLLCLILNFKNITICASHKTVNDPFQCFESERTTTETPKLFRSFM